jgi:uncharacterized protein (TIGR00369 family)
MPHDVRPTTADPLTAEPRPHFGLDIPFMRHIGLVPLSLEADRVVARLPKARFLENSRGDHHGGALMAALDFMMSAAARSHDPLGFGVITIEMSTHFLSAATGDLTVECRALRRGARIAFCDGTITATDGEVVCVSRAAFKLVPRARPGSEPGPRMA